MKILISILFFTHIVVFTVCSQTDFRYTESIKEVQEYLLNNDFTESLYILKNLEKEGYSNANMNYLIGVCYVNSLTNKQLSIDYLLRACNSVSKDYNSDNPSELNAPPEAILYLGDANLMNDKIKEARQCYLRYLNLSYIDEHKKDIARSRIKNCLFARLQMDNLLKVVFENAGKSINTGIANSNACISADGKKMVFLRSMKFYDAIFYAVKTDSGWQAPENITSQIGSDGEFIPTSLSFDGTRLLLMTFTDPDGNEIYESVYNGKKWDKVKRLEAPVNSKYHDIDASYGIDDHTIYFSSNRAGGFGGYDIYKANIDVTNKTYKVENLGNTINSLGDEKSPSLIENGKILVFNTNYRNSIGGYDYYYSQLLNIDKWSEPLDIGYPINSTSDDNELKFTATSPKKGWFSRSDPKGTSIYFFDCPMFSTLKLVPISGKVVINENIYADSENISLAVVDVAMHDTAFILKPNTDGSYFAELYPGKFKLIVKKQGEKDLEQAFSIPLSFNEENFSLESKFGEPALTKVSKKDTIQVVDILYGFNQWEISKDEKAMLNNLIVELKKHAVKSIQLNGYSDALGSEAYNVTLSFGRAQNVKEIFMAQGFSGKNIIVQGKGNSVYVAKNTNPDGKDNPEGRAFNRRVEIFITLESDTAVILRKDRVPEKLKLKNQ